MKDEAPSYETQFIECLPLVDRIVAGLGRRHGMSAGEVEEMSSDIKARIVVDEYAIFRKFRGESSLSTYLTVVIAMMAREHRVAARGRWRPSAAAARLGHEAVELETLVHRKGHALAEAAQVMRSRGATTLSDRQLGKLMRQLPRRAPLRPVEVGEGPLAAVTGTDDSASLVASEESSANRANVQGVLERTLAGLSLEDRLLLKLRFWQDASIADAARILGVDQRPLYRRLEKLTRDLRVRLASSGITAEQVRDLIGDTAT
jgi:RNA polymerase sigma factor for flagellar operon FliA